MSEASDVLAVSAPARLLQLLARCLSGLRKTAAGGPVGRILSSTLVFSCSLAVMSSTQPVLSCPAWMQLESALHATFTIDGLAWRVTGRRNAPCMSLYGPKNGIVSSCTPSGAVNGGGGTCTAGGANLTGPGHTSVAQLLVHAARVLCMLRDSISRRYMRDRCEPLFYICMILKVWREAMLARQL